MMGSAQSKTMLVHDRAAGFWISNFPSICEALVRHLCNQKPSTFLPGWQLEIPDPLFFTLRMRLGVPAKAHLPRRLGVAKRALLIRALLGKNAQLMLYHQRRNFLSGMLSDRKSQRKPARPRSSAQQTCQRSSQSGILNSTGRAWLRMDLGRVQLSQTLRFRLPAELAEKDRLFLCS